mgnify:CR=1 FL=1
MSLAAGPDRERALAAYRTLAAGYDDSSRRILEIRAAAVRALALRPGETAFDVGCGTGATIGALCAALGPRGRVVGIEQCPEMAAIARNRIAGCGCRAEVVVASAEDFRSPARADAMLFCYTHDVLQSAAALDRLVGHAAPGCRVAVAGIRFLPWGWGFAVNAVTAWRTRRYLTTYRGLLKPWAPLASRCASFRILRTFHAGSSYLAVGRLKD